MKRVVFSLSFFFLLFTLSHAFHPETLDLTQVFNHHHLHHKHKHHHHDLPSSDGSVSSKVLPTDDSSILDNSQSYLVEYKEAVSEPQIFPDENSNPVQMKNQYSFPVYRFNPIKCRQIHRFMRHPRRFGGVNELGFDPVLTYVLQNRDVARKVPEVERAIRMFDQHHMGPLHHPRHHHDHDHQRVEIKDEEEEEEERENKVEKKRKEKKDDDDEERENEVKKKRKERDDDEEDEDKDKDVLKKIRKFLNYF